MKRWLISAAIVATASPAWAQVANGSYECWQGTSARGILNFTIQGNAYIDSGNGRGTWSANGNRITFKGAGLDGMSGVYEVVGQQPKVGLIGPQGDIAYICDRVR